MKTFYTLLLSLTVLFLFGNSCQKEEYKIKKSDSNAVWVTPTGKVIPYLERDNWEEYIKLNFNQDKLARKGWTSKSCTTPTISCGLECVSSKKPAECNKESACAPCHNCGCYY